MTYHLEITPEGAVSLTVGPQAVPGEPPKYSRAPLADSRPHEIPVVDLPADAWLRERPEGDAPPVYVEPVLEAPAAAPSAPAVHTGRHTFREAGAHYVALHLNKLSIGQEKVWLEELDPFIGDLELGQIYDAKLQAFIQAQQAKPLAGGKIGVKSATINLKLGLVRHILRLAARSWRDDEGCTWLSQAPLITMVEGGDERQPRQLTWTEQREHLHKLPPHLHRMALFDLNSGVRDEVLCTLRWSWELYVKELDVVAFVVPPESVKGRKGKKTSRVLVCNSVARAIIEEVRGEHETHVFTYRHGKNGEPRPIETCNNTSWQGWRRRCGLGDLHVHDLRHTAGMRLREAGVAEDTRADILWHTRGNMTAHYSAGTVHEIHQALEKITDERFAHNKTLASLVAEQR